MKKTLMSTLLLAGIVGGMATTAHAADTATADTTMTASIESGGITIETVDKLDFGKLSIGQSSLKSQDVKVINLTGSKGVELTGKLDESMPLNVSLYSLDYNGDVESTMSTSSQRLYSAEPVGDPGGTPEGEVESPSNYDYKLDWKLSAAPGANLNNALSRTMTFTASPTV